MRSELRAIQQRVSITFIYITHDQGEALTMSDRIAVMSQSVIQQVGTGTEVYENSQTAFVAPLVGENHPITGKVVAAHGRHAGLETPFGLLRGTDPRSDEPRHNSSNEYASSKPTT